ncbi:hypothetical protein V5O48_015552 [Marasmius crinis-equi]|uniref:Zinc/iron permease n=1 Tax=Marasmius crinis-equi TaxID=585013 RepID=A0ABR3EU86_9AGAR
MGLRIASIFVIGVGSTMGALFPVLARRSKHFKVPKALFDFAKYFGSGVIIATAFIHLLAPALEAFGSECLAEGWSDYPYALALCMLSIFLLFVVEVIAFRWGTAKLAKLGQKYDAHGHEAGGSHAAHGPEHRRPSVDDESKKPSQPSQDHDTQLRDVEAASISTDDSSSATSKPHSHGILDNPLTQIIGIAILEFGVVLHSVLIGLTLAVDEDFKILFVVLVFHQTFEGLGLGSRLAYVRLPSPYQHVPILAAIVYGLTTPIGIAIGLGVRRTYNPGSTTASIVSGTLDSLSAGILIYTGLVELLAHEFLFNKEMMNASNTKLAYSLGSMVLGWGLMALLGRMSLLPLAWTRNAPKRPSRLLVIGILTLGVVLAFVLYLGELERDPYHVVSLEEADIEAPSNHSSQNSSVSLSPASSKDLDFEMQPIPTRQPTSNPIIPHPTPTTTTTPPSPTTVINNHVTYPILPPVERKELDAMRERHLKKIDEVLAWDYPSYPAYNKKQLSALKEYWPKAEGEQPKMNSFRENNQYLLYADYEELNKIYKKLGEIVTHVWSTDKDVIWCLNDTISCVQSPENPGGVYVDAPYIGRFEVEIESRPPWQLFTFTFWGSPQGWQNFFGPKEPWSYNPLGGEWNLVPYRYPDRHFYLGYYFAGCNDIPYVPHSERKDQILVLAKRSFYFHRYVFLETHVWPVLKEKLAGLDLISLSNQEDGYPVPESLNLIGPVDRHEYDVLLGSSKALLGVGMPRISPSPYASLLLDDISRSALTKHYTILAVAGKIPYSFTGTGIMNDILRVPVVVPYQGKKCPARPGDSIWCGDTHQHAPAAEIGPPYIYTVDAQGPIDDIIDTILTAVNTPIEPYIPPDMTKEALAERIKDYFSIDWKMYGEQRMRERGWDRIETQQHIYRWLENHAVPKQKTRSTV